MGLLFPRNASRCLRRKTRRLTTDIAQLEPLEARIMLSGTDPVLVVITHGFGADFSLSNGVIGQQNYTGLGIPDWVDSDEGMNASINGLLAAQAAKCTFFQKIPSKL